ncbi:MAG: hypothetical protein ACE5I1_14180 [bacterium]
MANTKRTESKPKDESQRQDFNFPCCDFEEMFKKMQEKFGGDGSSDCAEMMRQMCCGTSKEKVK